MGPSRSLPRRLVKTNDLTGRPIEALQDAISFFRYGSYDDFGPDGFHHPGRVLCSIRRNSDPVSYPHRM